MSATIVIVILVATGHARSPETSGVISAATEALGAGASIVLESVGTPTDRGALRAERRLQAAAVVELVWAATRSRAKQAVRPSVSVRVHLATERRWIDRKVTFAPKDTPLERGRTIGFTLASMLVPKIDIPRPPASPDPPPTAEVTTTAPQTSQPAQVVATAPPLTEVRRPERRSSGKPASALHNLPMEPAPTEFDPPAPPSSESPDELDPSDTLATKEARRRAPSNPWQYGVQVAAVGALGIGDPAPGYGAGAHFELSPGRVLGFRVGGGIRAGNVPVLEGNNIEGWAGVGVFWRPAALAGRRLGAGVHLDALAILHDVTHEAALVSTPTHERKLMSGASLGLEGAWHLASAVDALVVVSLEAAFGRTILTIGGKPPRDVGELPIFRGLTEVGVRLHF